MPRRKLSGSFQYLPTLGVRTDLKRFMNSFLASNTVRYENFSETWREKNMSYIFAGRLSDREAREFVEQLISIAQEYFLPPFQFQVRVGGLYLLYAIFETQPLLPKAKIRMTRAQWEDTMYFQQQAAQQNHLDVVYVFQRMVQHQAFAFCHTPFEMDPNSEMKEVDDPEENVADSLREEKSAISELFSYESLEQLSYLQDQYQQMKIGLAGPAATKPDKSLDVVHGELVEDLVVLMQSFKEKVSSISKHGQRTEEVPVEEDVVVNAEITGSRRHALKQQAYSQMISPFKKTHKVSSTVGSATPITPPPKAISFVTGIQNTGQGVRKISQVQVNAKYLETVMPSNDEHSISSRNKRSPRKHGTRQGVGRGQQNSKASPTREQRTPTVVQTKVEASVSTQTVRHNSSTNTSEAKKIAASAKTAMSRASRKEQTPEDQVPSQKVSKYELVILPAGVGHRSALIPNLSVNYSAANKINQGQGGQNASVYPYLSLNFVDNDTRVRNKRHLTTPKSRTVEEILVEKEKGQASVIKSLHSHCEMAKQSSVASKVEITPHINSKSHKSLSTEKCENFASFSDVRPKLKSDKCKSIQDTTSVPAKSPQEALQFLREKCIRTIEEEEDEPIDKFIMRCNKAKQKSQLAPSKHTHEEDIWDSLVSTSHEEVSLEKDPIHHKIVNRSRERDRQQITSFISLDEEEEIQPSNKKLKDVKSGTEIPTKKRKLQKEVDFSTGIPSTGEKTRKNIVQESKKIDISKTNSFRFI